jgi:glutathione S-transferase
MKREPGERTFYQIPISHYCEKSRWHLDAKGLTYRVVNVVPGANRLLGKWLGVRGTVPMLVDHGNAIGDSADIADYIERTYPKPSLLPPPDLRGRAREIAAYFDDRVAPDLRRFAYGSLLASRSGAAMEVMTAPYGPVVRLLFGRLMAPVVEREIARMYEITPETVASSLATGLEALDLLEREIDGDPGRYLLGDAFSMIDIGVAAVLAPLVGPPGTPWEHIAGMPDHVQALRESARARPAGAWVLRRYRENRGRGR